MWKIQDALEFYSVNNWGANFFSISENGNIEVHPTGDPSRAIDLKVLADEIQQRGIQLPLLVRFSDILRARIKMLCESFQNAIQECGYKSVYRGVYPIKVNQQRHVVATIVDAGKPFHYGLEAGSKPELLTTVALINDPEALVICNGYKDEEFIELALLARKVGKNVILVVEKLSELELIIRIAEKLHVQPCIGIRIRLSAKGSGRWEASGGDRSKFGLGPIELLQAVEWLRERNLLHYLNLLHYHLGSQITAIRSVKDALREAARYYVELKKMGAHLQYLDVGGGLAVDYDGSRTNFAASANYSMQEYANDVVYQIMTTCDEAKVEHPILVSESGRAVTAYHSVLVFNVLGVTEFKPVEPNPPASEDAPQLVKDLWDSYQSLSRKNFEEAFH
ncbi:MAG: biosynthetic arginine decarboxylase, partial [candidate division KSB1 bacterium]